MLHGYHPVWLRNSRGGMMSWTDERVEVLKKMWGEGQSASVIAKELGGVTRNAVIGKVHRLGLSNRVTSTTAKPAVKEKAKAQVKAKPAAPTTPAAPPKPAGLRSKPCGSPRLRCARSFLPVSLCRRSPQPMRSAPKLWQKSVKWKRLLRRSA